MTHGNMGPSDWDPRTLKLIEEHGLDEKRYISWLDVYKDPKKVEYEYLRHLLMEQKNIINGKVTTLAYGDDPLIREQGLELLKKAKEVCDLMIDVDPSIDPAVSRYTSDDCMKVIEMASFGKDYSNTMLVACSFRDIYDDWLEILTDNI